jgi:serine/threonine protein kinase
MALSAGTRLGPYEILAAIGAGGMGEVYRARDSRLNRDVALKVLPEISAVDASRVARFEREAQLLAALNHPGIAAIYGVEHSDATPVLILSSSKAARWPIDWPLVHWRSTKCFAWRTKWRSPSRRRTRKVSCIAI